jgi:hypothetical protein
MASLRLRVTFIGGSDGSDGGGGGGDGGVVVNCTRANTQLNTAFICNKHADLL